MHFTLYVLEGKVQEAVGEFTGDPKDQAEGKAKQVQAAAEHEKENIKEEIDNAVDQKMS
ncbi:MAG: CsbD family protein [Leptolyngbya sp. SIO4C5]|nr:CsbD family protein [Leptolyngbya sp. SIO4C5]